MYHPLTYQFAHWQSGAEFNASTVEASLDDELPGLMEQIGATAGDDPGAAFAEFVKLMGFLNEAVRLRASILEKIAKQIDKLRDALGKIAARFGATSFDINVGWPGGVSVSVTFSTSKTSRGRRWGPVANRALDVRQAPAVDGLVVVSVSHRQGLESREPRFRRPARSVVECEWCIA